MENDVIKCRYFLELSQYLHICFWWFISLIYRRLKWKRNNFVIPMCRMWWNCQIMTQVLNTPTHTHTRPHSSGADLKWILLSPPAPYCIGVSCCDLDFHFKNLDSINFFDFLSSSESDAAWMMRDGERWTIWQDNTTTSTSTRRDAMFQLGSSSHSPA